MEVKIFLIQKCISYSCLAFFSPISSIQLTAVVSPSWKSWTSGRLMKCSLRNVVTRFDFDRKKVLKLKVFKEISDRERSFGGRIFGWARSRSFSQTQIFRTSKENLVFVRAPCIVPGSKVDCNVFNILHFRLDTSANFGHTPIFPGYGY